MNPAATPSSASSSLRQRIARWVPCLAWPRPSAALLRNEAMAGITVALMVLPQGVAYAALAGMPLVTGVYAALFPALIAVIFSSSQRLSVGPRRSPACWWAHRSRRWRCPAAPNGWKWRCGSR